MARKPRVQFPGAIYHDMNRGLSETVGRLTTLPAPVGEKKTMIKNMRTCG
jgi:hypothetical protein